ncbi:MAG: M50 family metallopeptidase [Deinococcota bacterium]
MRGALRLRSTHSCQSQTLTVTLVMVFMPFLITLLIILVTTFRHEGSHALATVLQGVELIEVRLLPGVREDVGFYFGYVIRGDGGTWLIDAAPFISAVVWFLIAYIILRNRTLPNRLWLLVFLIGIVSPLVDLIYNYQGGFWREGSDVADLLVSLPDVVVHLYFGVAIALCGLAARTLWLKHHHQG